MAVTSSASANAPASRPHPRLFWSRTHFLIRLLGITGALVGCAGLVLAAVEGELRPSTACKALKRLTRPA